ncbi:diacylglycerol kinase [Aliiglaciecola sp. LCG003]|uniref:diacylglycerol kinase n=1 Tax=Aliiglaciecola sp. LCG003 TaxID=3053655 RepID=UPI0025733D35|nr:diacylglycerol kinase [Aliiglaciecola sp. LCG003]WJG09902.1 diacylglycerol kinase [Aliiglaciecola sp. LCG003]
MHTVVNKPNGQGFKRVLKATTCSIKGFRAAWIHESAFRQECTLALLLTPLSFILAQSRMHWLMLIASILFMLFAEIVNSALEALSDSVTLEHNVLIGRAKDLGSSAVFIALSLLALVWGEALFCWLI